LISAVFFKDSNQADNFCNNPFVCSTDCIALYSNGSVGKLPTEFTLTKNTPPFPLIGSDIFDCRFLLNAAPIIFGSSPIPFMICEPSVRVESAPAILIGWLYIDVAVSNEFALDNFSFIIAAFFLFSKLTLPKVSPCLRLEVPPVEFFLR